MDLYKSIIKSIILTMIILFFGQIVLANIFILSFKLKHQALFFICALIFNLIVLTMLLIFRKSFYFSSNNKILKKINFTNILTLIRITSVPTLCYLIIVADTKPDIYPYLIVFSFLVFITDLFDGMISRKTNQITEIGKILDSTSDYTVIAAISVVFLVKHLLPIWFFALLLFRLVFHAVGMITLSVVKKGIHHRTSFLGKASVFSTMTLFGVVLAAIFLPSIFPPLLVRIIEYITATIISVSIIDKGIIMLKVSKIQTSIKTSIHTNK